MTTPAKKNPYTSKIRTITEKRRKMPDGKDLSKSDVEALKTLRKKSKTWSDKNTSYMTGKRLDKK